MTLFKPARFAAATTVVMIGISVYMVNAVPDLSTRVPITLMDHPFTDRHAAVILFVMPLVTALLAAVFALLSVIPPLRSGLDRSALPCLVIGYSLVIMTLALHLILIVGVMGYPVDIARACIVASGALLVVVGNYLPKVRYNFAIGVRTPWTLADERVWDRSHRVVGAGLVIAGVIAVLGGWLIENHILAVASLLLPVVTVAIVAIVYPATLSSGARLAHRPGESETSTSLRG